MWKLSCAPRRKKNRSPRGFTIIEALIALALVSSVITVIGSVVATTALGVRSLEQHLSSVQIARGVVAGLPLNNTLVLKNISGETEGYHWQIKPSSFLAVSQKQEARSSLVPIKLDVEVRSPRGTVIHLETIRLQPRGAE
jgi:general secretion pathway protein I